MSIFPALEARLRQNFLALFVAGFLFWASLSSLLPTLPLYLRDLGGREQQIGLAMGAFAVGVLACRSWLGRLADQRSRKLVLLLGLAITALAPLGYTLAHTLLMVTLVRIAHGVSIAAFTTAFSALVVDLSPARQRGELLGYMLLCNPLGTAIGPALGGLLQSQLGHTSAFLLAAGLGGLGLLCAYQVWENPIAASDTTDREPFWSLLGSPRVRVPALILLLVGLIFGGITTFVPLFIEQASVDLNSGWFYTAIAVASFAVRFPAGRASDHYGRALFITISLVFYSLSMLCLWSAHSAVAFLLAGTLEGLGAGMLIPMMAALMADRAGPQERARLFSLCLGGFDLGIGLAGPIFGLVAAEIGYRNLFGCTAGLAVLALAIFATQSSKTPAHSLRFALGRGPDVYAIKPCR